MKKRICILIAVILSAFGMSALFAACDEEEKVTNVSTAEEFLSSRGTVSLQNDIDFNYATLSRFSTGIVVRGNNFKLSNAVVTGSGYVFGLGTENLTVENFDVTVPNATSFGFIADAISYGVVGGKKNTFKVNIENVHIKNCKVTVNIHAPDYSSNPNCIGGLIGYVHSSGYDLSENSAVKFTNCSVEGLEINTTAPVTTSVYKQAGPIYVGGLVGRGVYVKMDGCHAKDCTLNTTAGDTYDYIRTGGLIGYMEKGGDLSHCYVRNCKISAKAKIYTSSLFDNTTSVTRVGGLAGSSEENTKINTCYSEGNTITSDCSGGCYMGGLAGFANCSVTQSYAVNNSMVIKGRLENDGGSKEFYIGGISGFAGGVLISSSFAFGNTVNVGLKNVNSKYFYYSDYDMSVCKDFLEKFHKLYTTDKAGLDKYLQSIRETGRYDKEALDSFLDDVNSKNLKSESAWASYINSYYNSVSSAYKQLDKIYTAGLTGYANGDAIVQNCAAGMSGTNCHYDNFCKSVLSPSLFNETENYVLCTYSDANVNGCTVFDAADSIYGSALTECLLLNDDKWVQSATGLPALDI